MASTSGNAKGVNLNLAKSEELDRIGGPGQARARRITENRHSNAWDDLKRVEGFSDTLVNDLREAGATLGR
jgi:DNA uptake protein ComE-like DNA-binding protein